MELQKVLRPVLRLPFRTKPALPRAAQRTFTTSFARLADSSDSQDVPKNPGANKSSSGSIASDVQTILDTAPPTSSSDATPTPADTRTTSSPPPLSSFSPAGNQSVFPPAQGEGRRTGSALSNLIESLKPKEAGDGAAGGGRRSGLSADKNAPLHAHRMEEQPWHLHIFSHKHNTHLTLTRPNRRAVISISAGNIGFRKSQRGGYDAAYQLGAYLMARIERAGLLREIDELEVLFRGFGNGREAMTKILQGAEGAGLRGSITRVTDATRLKFGGTRSKAPRRLG